MVSENEERDEKEKKAKSQVTVPKIRKTVHKVMSKHYKSKFYKKKDLVDKALSKLSLENTQKNRMRVLNQVNVWIDTKESDDKCKDPKEDSKKDTKKGILRRSQCKNIVKAHLAEQKRLDEQKKQIDKILNTDYKMRVDDEATQEEEEDQQNNKSNGDDVARDKEDTVPNEKGKEVSVLELLTQLILKNKDKIDLRFLQEDPQPKTTSQAESCKCKVDPPLIDLTLDEVKTEPETEDKVSPIKEPETKQAAAAAVTSETNVEQWKNWIHQQQYYQLYQWYQYNQQCYQQQLSQPQTQQPQTQPQQYYGQNQPYAVQYSQYGQYSTQTGPANPGQNQPYAAQNGQYGQHLTQTGPANPGQNQPYAAQNGQYGQQLTQIGPANPGQNQPYAAQNSLYGQQLAQIGPANPGQNQPYAAQNSLYGQQLTQTRPANPGQNQPHTYENGPVYYSQEDQKPNYVHQNFY